MTLLHGSRRALLVVLLSRLGLLLEDGSFLLLEDGGALELES